MKLRTRKFFAGLLSLGLLLQAASPLSALAALLVWNTAGRPEPVNTPAFADVADADTAKAARWAVEAGLLPDMGEGVFTPGKRVTKVQVIRAWNQLKKLGLAK